MITIVAGSRGITDYGIIAEAIAEAGWEITVLVHGAARGVDKISARWAMNNDVPTIAYPADWDKYGRSAGPIRNRLMAGKAKALVAVWDGKSPGTKDMIDVAEAAGLKVHVKKVLQ